jgi:vacuolar protein sorting-associated protein 54
LLSDAEYFKSQISKIDGSGDLGDLLVQVTNAKTIVPEKNGDHGPQSPNGSPPVPEKDTPVSAEKEPAAEAKS